jgi:hypothetical protein
MDGERVDEATAAAAIAGRCARARARLSPWPASPRGLSHWEGIRCFLAGPSEWLPSLQVLAKAL